MPDITALIMDDHEWFRRQFAALDDATDVQELERIWTPLGRRLDTHAEAEETVFYPHLLKKGGSDAQDETDDAIGDHNEIRDAVAGAFAAQVGSEEWFTHVDKAREENSEHLAEEEDGALKDFRQHASADLRASLGERWLAFYAAHPYGQGIDPSDRDKDEYIARNS